ncbi:MAG: NTP transferase domain-containing protein [bacterium]|nr:NTP transferase domain-containing protein [bacterium]
MKVIVPVAGVGSRLRPHTHSTPKVLLPVAGRPILDHVLEPIARLQPEEVAFVVGYLGAEIEAYIQANYSFKARFVWQERLLGLGHAINLAVQQLADGPMLVVLGDTIVETDLKKFIAAGDYVLGLRQVADPHRFGIAEVANGVVSHLEEKPEHPNTNLAVIGLYYFHESQTLRKALKENSDSGLTTQGEVQFTDALERMIKGGTKFLPYEVTGWYDCGKKETVLETNQHFLKSMHNTVSRDGCAIIPPVFIADSARVTASVIGPYVAISDDAVVENSVIKNTIIGPKAIVRNLILHDSLVGSNATLNGVSSVVNVGDSSETAFT